MSTPWSHWSPLFDNPPFRSTTQNKVFFNFQNCYFSKKTWFCVSRRLKCRVTIVAEHRAQMENLLGRDRPSFFFDQVGHQTTDASIGNKQKIERT